MLVVPPAFEEDGVRSNFKSRSFSEVLDYSRLQFEKKYTSLYKIALPKNKQRKKSKSQDAPPSSIHFDDEREFSVVVSEEFLEYVQEDALSIEVRLTI